LVAEQLADDLGCHAEDLTSDEVVVVPTALRQGRRRFPVAARSLQVVSMERGVVVSCDDTRLAAVHSLLAGVAPMAVLQVPLLARLHTLVADDGQNLYGPFQHAVCWPETFRPAASPPDVSIALLEGLAVAQIYHEPGFDNALEYDLAASRPDVLAATATIKGQLVGVAGVSADSDRLWQIGVDVRTPFRNSGIGTALVGRVTEAVFAAGRVPYYATPIAHLASARIALRLGYVPAWIAAYTRALRGCATPE
jgi:RimJ/RimL family protein N-acetyltransferase